MAPEACTPSTRPSSFSGRRRRASAASLHLHSRRLPNRGLPPARRLHGCRIGATAPRTSTTRRARVHRPRPSDGQPLSKAARVARGYDWYYASTSDRAPEGARHGRGQALVFRCKDLRSWWSNPHYDRPGGTESGTPTVMDARKQARLVHRAGLPGNRQEAPNQPNVFYDPKSAESLLPYFSRGWRGSPPSNLCGSSAHAISRC